jgi:hypothetical protein
VPGRARSFYDFLGVLGALCGSIRFLPGRKTLETMRREAAMRLMKKILFLFATLLHR